MDNPNHNRRTNQSVLVALCSARNLTFGLRATFASVALLLASCNKGPRYTYERAVEFSNGLPSENSEVVVAIVGTTNGPFRHAGCATLGEGQPGSFGYKSKDGAPVSWRRPTNETGVLTCYSFVDDNESAMLVIKKRLAD